MLIIPHDIGNGLRLFITPVFAHSYNMKMTSVLLQLVTLLVKLKTDERLQSVTQYKNVYVDYY